MSEEVEKEKKFLDKLSPKIRQELKRFADRLEVLQQENEVIVDTNGLVLDPVRLKEINQKTKEVFNSMQKLLKEHYSAGK